MGLKVSVDVDLWCRLAAGAGARIGVRLSEVRGNGGRGGILRVTEFRRCVVVLGRDWKMAWRLYIVYERDKRR